MTLRFDFLGFVVADMARTVDFYRRLGLDLPVGAEGETHVEYVTPEGFRLAWDTHEVVRSFEPDWVPPTGGHLMAPAFSAGSPAEVDALYSELVAAGYRGFHEPWDAFWGQRYAAVLDPDGNTIDLYAALPPVEPTA